MPTHQSIHNPDIFMVDLRQILSQGRKRIGILLGAGAPTAIRVDCKNQLVEDGGQPLIPDVNGLTSSVVGKLEDRDKPIIEMLTLEVTEPINIEKLLTKVRRLSEAIGDARVHGLDAVGYDALAGRICDAIGNIVSSHLPIGPNPYSDLVRWISGTKRQHSVELFTPNYDLLIEEAFERARVPFFDGFTGSHRPFFDAASVSSDRLPLGGRVSGSCMVPLVGRFTAMLL